MLEKRYSEMTATHEYIFGFVYKKGVYAYRIHLEELGEFAKTSKTSKAKGSKETLRFRPSAQLKYKMLMDGAFEIISREDFEKAVENSIYNQGDVFEKIVAEHYGKEWKKNSTPFWEDGDLEVDGVKIQVKFYGATFATSKIIER